MRVTTLALVCLLGFAGCASRPTAPAPEPALPMAGFGWVIALPDPTGDGDDLVSYPQGGDPARRALVQMSATVGPADVGEVTVRLSPMGAATSLAGGTVKPTHLTVVEAWLPGEVRPDERTDVVVEVEVGGAVQADPDGTWATSGRVVRRRENSTSQ